MDTGILNFIQVHMKCAFLDAVMPFITSLGNFGLLWVGLCIVLLFFKKYRKTGFLGLLAMLLCTVLGEAIVKPAVGRLRPFVHNPALELLIMKPLSYSFPSGHTASSFAAATVLSRLGLKAGLAAFAGAVLIAFSRLYLYVHYPTDVLAGIVLGVFSALLVLGVNKRIEKKKGTLPR